MSNPSAPAASHNGHRTPATLCAGDAMYVPCEVSARHTHATMSSSCSSILAAKDGSDSSSARSGRVVPRSFTPGANRLKEQYGHAVPLWSRRFTSGFARDVKSCPHSRQCQCKGREYPTGVNAGSRPSSAHSSMSPPCAETGSFTAQYRHRNPFLDTSLTSLRTWCPLPHMNHLRWMLVALMESGESGLRASSQSRESGMSENGVLSALRSRILFPIVRPAHTGQPCPRLHLLTMWFIHMWPHSWHLQCTLRLEPDVRPTGASGQDGSSWFAT